MVLGLLMYLNFSPVYSCCGNLVIGVFRTGTVSLYNSGDIDKDIPAPATQNRNKILSQF